MMIVQFILVAVEVFVSLLLIILILMQKSKSEGLGLAFGSGMGEALFGSRAGNVLSKATIALAIVFLVNTLLLSMLFAASRGQTLMGRFVGRPAPVGQAAPGPRPAGEGSATAPRSAAGAPTLPGTDLGDAPAAPAPAAPESAPEP